MKLSSALPSSCKIFYLATVFVKGKITAPSGASRWLLRSSSSRSKPGPSKGPKRLKFQVKIQGSEGLFLKSDLSIRIDKSSVFLGKIG